MGITINGQIHDFGCVEIEFGAQLVIIETRSIDYDDGTNGENVFGASRQRIGRTPGQYEANGSWTMTKRGQEKLLKALGEGFYDKTINVRVKYRDVDNAGEIVDELRGTQLIKNANSHSNGASALEGSNDVSIGVILWNGIPPLKDMVI